VSVRLGSGAAALAGNLLANGGFEQGLAARLPTQSPAIPGWTSTGGMTFVRYGAVPHLGFPSHLDAPRYATGGLNFLSGGDSTGLGGVTTATQTGDVSDSAEPIDGGRATANLSAYLGGAQSYPDRMAATAEFLDATGAGLGALQVGPVTNADRRNVTTLLRRENSAPVPVGTRRIRVTLTSTDVDTLSSAMADNVKLTLDAAPPAPALGPSSRPSSPQPTFGAGTKVTVKLAASRIGARGPVRAVVSNTNAFGVTGTLAGATTIRAKRGVIKLAAKRFAVAASGRTLVRLALSKALRRELQRKRKLVLRLSVVVQDPAGNRRTVRNQVSPRLRRAAKTTS
jgi:hypothetical protein